MSGEAQARLISEFKDMLDTEHIHVVVEAFRRVVLLNDKELVKRIWEAFPLHAWTYACGFLFEELSREGMRDMMELFIEQHKLHGGACYYAEQYRKDPDAWMHSYAHRMF